MKKESFDFVCSLGSSCLCATALRDAGLRFSSGPFDWLYGPPLKNRVDTVVGDFAGWFESEDFEFVGNPEKFEHDSYANRRTGYTFPHEFDLGRPFAESYPGVRAKYDRRIARFYERIRASRRVLFVWLENPLVDDRPSDDEVAASHKALSEKFPGVQVELLVVDRAPDDAGVHGLVRHDGYWRATCPYRRNATEPGKEARYWNVNTRPVLELLSDFQSRDYRSAAERRRHASASRRAKYALLGARGALGYVVARLQVKVCKLLLNRLRRKGVDMRRLFEVQIKG